MSIISEVIETFQPYPGVFVLLLVGHDEAAIIDCQDFSMVTDSFMTAFSKLKVVNVLVGDNAP